MLGAIFGDIVGFVYEHFNTKREDFQLLSEWSRPTDDSIMTLAVAKALMNSRGENDEEIKRELSEKFWKLEKRINSDKRCTGVMVIGMSRSKMYQHLVSLAYEGVIGPDDLDGFSDELREQLAYVVGKNHKL